MRQTKAFPVSFKALATDGPAAGEFEALVSVFDNVDLVNDRVMKGAFTKSIQTWQESGDPIPVIFSHQWDNLDAIVGEVTEASENEKGLLIKGQLDLDEPFALKLFNQMRRRRIKEFSFAYDILDSQTAKDGVNELLELAIIEVGPTLKGANPATELLTVKNEKPADADALKSGRTLSAKNENKLQQAMALLEEVVKSVSETASDSSKDETSKTEEPEGFKVETGLNPAAVRMLTDVLLADFG